MKKQNIFIYAVFALYVLVLLKVLFLSRTSVSALLDSSRPLHRSFNFIPLFTIRQYAKAYAAGVGPFAVANVFGNVAAFVPLGVYWAYCKKGKKYLSVFAFICAASLLAECVQGLFALGAADVDDLLLNSIGGLLGILAYWLLSRLLRQKERIQIAMTVLSALALPIFLYLLFVIQMRF